MIWFLKGREGEKERGKEIRRKGRRKGGKERSRGGGEIVKDQSSEPDRDGFEAWLCF